MTRSHVEPEAQKITTTTNTSQYQVPNTRRKRLRDSLELEHVLPSVETKKRRLEVHIEKGVRALQIQDKFIKPETINVTYKNIPRQTSSTTSSTLSPLPSRQHTVHQEKVAAGLKHELDRLQPAASDRNTGDEKRKLRSQESSRFKSELALYFPDYDFVIGNDEEEKHVLDVDTSIVIIDSRPPPSRASSPGKIRIPKTISRLSPKIYPTSLYTSLNETEHVDLSVFKDDIDPSPILQDPLDHPMYSISHKRQERLERSIRNTEKGRAQHERDQVIRLLESLESGDWLKCMGVTGITESRRKEFFGARDYFIKGCQAIVDKFKCWKEEERRRKALKDQLLAEEDEDAEGLDDDIDDNASNGDPPDHSDADHAAARQLHEEALSLGGKPSKDVPTSLYKKPYLREAAMDTNRRSTRGLTAFGVSLPQFEDKPFVLPPEILEGRDQVNERSRRREKRTSR